MPVDVTGLRAKVARHAEETSRRASREIEQELRAKAKTLSVWDYTHARRDTFLPHLALHGVEFDRPDDDVLANPDSFPRTSHYHPGDHKGCLCKTRPSRRGVQRTSIGLTKWRITSEPPRIAAARVGSSRVTVARKGLPEWAKPILSRSNWIAKVRAAVGGRVRA